MSFRLESRSTAGQLILSPIAGLAQIAFFGNLLRDLSPIEYGIAAMALMAPLLLQFLDLGSNHVCFISWNSISKMDKEVSSVAMGNILLSLTTVTIVSIFGVVTTVALVLFTDQSNFLLLVIAINFINVPFAWIIASIRSVGNHLLYVVFFNSTWPLSYIFLKILNFGGYRPSIELSLVPVLISIFTGLVTIPILYSRIKQNYDYLSFKDASFQPRVYLTESFTAALFNIFGTLLTHLDKYFVGLLFGAAAAGSYVSHSIISIGLFSVLSVLFIEKLAKKYSSDLDSKNLFLFFTMSLVLAFGNYFGTLIIFKSVYRTTNFDPLLTVGFSSQIIAVGLNLGLLLRQNIGSISEIRTFSAFLALISFSTTTFLFQNFISLWTIPFIWSAFTIFSLSVSVRAINGRYKS
jgi:hypothetical protein